jgi:hypothetical protein
MAVCLGQQSAEKVSRGGRSERREGLHRSPCFVLSPMISPCRPKRFCTLRDIPGTSVSETYGGVPGTGSLSWRFENCACRGSSRPPVGCCALPVKDAKAGSLEHERGRGRSSSSMPTRRQKIPVRHRARESCKLGSIIRPMSASLGSRGKQDEMVYAILADRGGQSLTAGDALLHCPSKGRGIFWPDDVKVLDAYYPKATLHVAGTPGEVRIKRVRQSWSPWHWKFVIEV